MDDDIKFNPGDLKFTFGWCELCEAVFVRCPKCGNNTCNGGSGDINGKRCDMCGATYQYAKLFDRTGCELCDHWRKTDGGFCVLTKNFPEIHPCKKFTGITKDKGEPMTIDEEANLRKIFGEPECDKNQEKKSVDNQASV